MMSSTVDLMSAFASALLGKSKTKSKSKSKPDTDQMQWEKQSDPQFVDDNRKVEICPNAFGFDLEFIDSEDAKPLHSGKRTNSICCWGDETLHIDMLPHELLVQIFSFLDPKELLCASKTCHDWKILSEGIFCHYVSS